MYIFLALLSALFLGCYEVLKKVSLKKSSIHETLFFYCLCGLFVSLIFIKDAISIGFLDVLFILIKSGVIVLNWFLVLKCMQKLDVAIVVCFSLLNTILVVFLSHFIFDEVITIMHFLSLLFIATGIVLITMLDRKENKDKVKNHYIYIILLIFGSVLGSCSAMLDKYLINVREVESGAVLLWFLLFNSLIYGTIYLYKNKKIEWKKLKANYWLVLTGVGIALADIVYYSAIASIGAQISLISILRKCSVIVATILASLFLKEKHLFKKLGILLIMIIGIVIPIIFK